MTVVVKDTFTDTSGMLLTSHTPDISPNSIKWSWYRNPAYSSDTTDTINASNQLNHNYKDAGTTDGGACINAGISDGVVTATLISGSGSPNPHVSVRVNPVDGSRIYIENGSVFSFNGSSYVNMGSVPVPANGSTIKFTLNGSSISVQVDNNTSVNFTSTINQSQTYHGLGSGSGTVVWDNFEVDTLSTGGTNASITSVIANTTAASLVPTVAAQKQVSVSGVMANSTASALAPSVSTTSSVSANISGAVANANASTVIPAISTSGNVSISGVVASASTNAVNPSVNTSGSISISSAVANSNANALNAVISTGNTIASVTATASAAGLEPQVGSFTNVNINASVSNATASETIPSVSAIRNISMNVPVTNTTAFAFVPAVSSGSSVNIPAVLASLVANAVAPSVSISNGIQVQPSIARASTNAYPPTIQTDIIISAIVAAMKASGIAPNINGKMIIGTVYLKGSRILAVQLNGRQELSIELNGNQVLDINLKGVV